MRHPLLLLLAATALAGDPTFEEVFDPSKFPAVAEVTESRQAAFEAAAKAHGAGSAVTAFRACEIGVTELRARMDKDYAAYDKVSDKWWAWRSSYDLYYKETHGRSPAVYPMPEDLSRAYLAAELTFRRSRSMLLQQRLFHDWALKRTAELVRDGKGMDAVARGLSDPSAARRLRCARLADQETAARAVDGEDQPGVLAALAEAAPSESLVAHPAWPVRAGAIRGTAKLGTREAARWLVARLDKERGRLLDDVTEALRRMSGEDIGSDPAAWRTWWDALPADWRAKGGGAGDGATNEAPKVRGTFSQGPVSFFGVASGTQAAVYCVQASANPEAWAKVREEVKLSLATLRNGAQFGIVAYEYEAHAFKTSLVQANATNRAAAARWLDGLKPSNGADTYAGLEATLALAAGRTKVPAADTIFLVALKDSPGGTLFDEPQQVMLEICAANSLLGVRIHAIGPSNGGSAFYLHHLANQFSGSHVDG